MSIAHYHSGMVVNEDIDGNPFSSIRLFNVFCGVGVSLTGGRLPFSHNSLKANVVVLGNRSDL